MSTSESSDTFQADVVEYLRGTYLPRLEQAASILPQTDLWWSAHSDCISFGTILRHLEGNVRQWIVSGLGGASDTRQRAAEFQGNSDESVSALLRRLRTTVEAACEVITKLPPTSLPEAITIQGFQTTRQSALLHVLEHFSWHVGQAVWIAKARAGEEHGLAFYDEEAINNPPTPGDSPSA